MKVGGDAGGEWIGIFIAFPFLDFSMNQTGTGVKDLRILLETLLWKTGSSYNNW